MTSVCVAPRYMQADGINPDAGLALEDAANVYGTATFGGDLSACSRSGCGVLFNLFPAVADGAVPSAMLLRRVQPEICMAPQIEVAIYQPVPELGVASCSSSSWRPISRSQLLFETISGELNEN